MKNFEEALIRIENLEKENQNLRDKLYASRKSKELPEVNKLVDSTSSQNIRNIKKEADAAMKRFTAKLRRDNKQYKKDSDG
jgi:hypothetical protein